MNKKISIVCTVYNDQNEIKNLLDDISMQTLLPDEVVIADGGSKDNTIKIINDYKGKNAINIKLIYGERLNISQGFNTAIRNSEYDIIIIMGTGNRYDKNFIEQIIEKFVKTDADIVFAPIRGNNDSNFSELYNRAFLKGEYGSRNPSNHGVLIKKEVFQKIGLFYENFIYAGEDAEFFERAIINKLNIQCAEDAKLKWDVPNNLKTFKKQVNGYTIAKMQIESCNILKKYKRNYLILAMLIIALMSIVLKQYYFAIMIMVIYIAYLVYKCIKNGIKEYVMIQYRKWLEMKVIMFNLDKLEKKYKVDKELIQKL